MVKATPELGKVKSQREANFKKELADLLERYNASIDAECDECSDLHGVTGEKLVVTMRDPESSRVINELEIGCAWSVDASDFERDQS